MIKALREMKSGKAMGPSEVSNEMIKYAGETSLDYLTRVFQKLLKEECVPHGWNESITIPLYKGKGEALMCGNYRG